MSRDGRGNDSFVPRCRNDECGHPISQHHKRGCDSCSCPGWRDTDPPMSDETRTVTVDRFWSKVERRGLDDCWLWTGPRTDGYGSFGTQRAHRFAYHLLVGPVPVGMTLDHLCRVRHCVNPRHLEPVSNRENVLRGVGPTAINAAKTTCKRGHPLASGIRRDRATERGCLTCHALRNREYRKRQAEARRA